MNRKFIFLLLSTVLIYSSSGAQNIQFQEGILLKSGTSLRIGNVEVLNKQSRATVRSNIYGVFKIPAHAGDTLQFKSDTYQGTECVVADFNDRVIYMSPIIQLAEVTIQENSLKSEIRETQLGYRRKSVFYAGTPHYYYLFLKPMTFIYENFKSEVRDARRFNKYAKQELATAQIYERFNDKIIRSIVPIPENKLRDFELTYLPTIQQINSMNDYELINYIKDCYDDYLTKTREN